MVLKVVLSVLSSSSIDIMHKLENDLYVFESGKKVQGKFFRIKWLI